MVAVLRFCYGRDALEAVRVRALVAHVEFVLNRVWSIVSIECAGLCPSSVRLQRLLQSCTRRFLRVPPPGQYEGSWQVPAARVGFERTEVELLELYDGDAEKKVEQVLKRVWWNSTAPVRSRGPKPLFSHVGAGVVARRVVAAMNMCWQEYEQCFRCVLLEPVVEEMRHLGVCYFLGEASVEVWLQSAGV